MRWGAISEIYVLFKNGQPDFLISKWVNVFYVNGMGTESLAVTNSFKINSFI
jgi:hypothetical protein